MKLLITNGKMRSHKLIGSKPVRDRTTLENCAFNLKPCIYSDINEWDLIFHI